MRWRSLAWYVILAPLTSSAIRVAASSCSAGMAFERLPRQRYHTA